MNKTEHASQLHACPHEECAEPDRCLQAAACVDSWGYVNAVETAPVASLDVHAAYIARLRALLDDHRIRDVLGYIKDAGPADVWACAQSWMAGRDAALTQQEQV